MSIPPGQSEAAALLARLTGDDSPVETHISAVFVGRGRALKLKKAVNLGFLDFTALPERERFCRRELALNAPAAPGLYRAVHPLTRDADGALALGGAGSPEEWVLEMAELPPDGFLDGLAARGGLDAPLQDALADRLHALHAALPPVSGWDAAGEMRRVVEGNRDAAHAVGLPAAAVDAWAGAALAELDRLAPALAARAAAGQVRRCHGDLHLGNWVMWRGEPVPFDALEFDEVLATIDIGYDLAFLLTDLDQRVGRGAANRVLNRYLARGADIGLLAGLPFWMSVRALIRAHCLQRMNGSGQPRLEAARSYLHRPPARMLAVGGLPGSGKSRLARALAPGLGAAPGALVLRSDEIRKRQHGAAPEQRLPPDAYGAAASAAVHDELFAMAEAAARAGHSVIADAAFLDPAMRAGIEEAARRAGVPFAGFWLEAPLEVLEARVAARIGDASDADVAVLKRAAAAGAGAVVWMPLDATQDCLAAARKALGH
ncbi:AAA family ATPase [Roseomonas marmotae]|uniref:AAA family ATPase n=1 Tax=Roseomonas marmotae TaxID=2768161 RepID=A0ABS3K9U6_9PROT|nr:AAA family ATPase [Roseomonas marmotae]